MAAERLAGRTESELEEIQAWRRAFARMGLKPTQYRCAAESLLRRFRKEGALPRIHPVVDLVQRGLARVRDPGRASSTWTRSPATWRSGRATATRAT